VAMHDPRANTGQALSYVTSPRGACHNQSDFFLVEMGWAIEELDIPMTDRAVSAGKAGYVARHQDFRTACNSLVSCFFAASPPSTLAGLLSAASGREWPVAEMVKAGERAWNLKRLVNLRLGWTPAQEKLPDLLLRSLPESGQNGIVPDMDVLLNEYYAARGWERASGAPTREKIAELGLDEFHKQ
jgi:aldehyde:ferredoxin oxidoreductase